MRAVVLLNRDDSVPAWQYEALSSAMQAGLEVALVAHCMNPPKRTVTRRSLPYYALAWFVRRRQNSVAPSHLNEILPANVQRIRFNAQTEGAWQQIPDSIAQAFSGADVIVKFGMNLLRGADDLPVPYGVLSYHHGAPERFRGRPASFYELLYGSKTQGVIVQRISDTLDGGSILARATSQVHPYSYRKTNENAHKAGVPLLAKAVTALEAGDKGVPPEQLGKNYRLPGPSVVAMQMCKLAKAKAARMLYGFCIQKYWRCGFSDYRLDFEGANIVPKDSIREIPVPTGYNFAADPFLCADGSVVAELLESATGRGVIGHWSEGSWETGIVNIAGHASYPHVVRHGSLEYLFPEIASVSSPRLFQLGKLGQSLDEGVALEGMEDTRLVDATIHQHEGFWYLFGGLAEHGEHRLDLWVAPFLEGPYSLHPSSPISMDVRGARMAGSLLQSKGALYRFGQDCSSRYGGRIRIHRINRLTPEKYDEVECGSIAVDKSWGPHTVNVGAAGELLLDFYEEGFDILAGYRRLAPKLSRIGGWINASRRRSK